MCVCVCVCAEKIKRDGGSESYQMCVKEDECMYAANQMNNASCVCVCVCVCVFTLQCTHTHTQPVSHIHVHSAIHTHTHRHVERRLSRRQPCISRERRERGERGWE